VSVLFVINAAWLYAMCSGGMVMLGRIVVEQGHNYNLEAFSEKWQLDTNII